MELLREKQIQQIVTAIAAMKEQNSDLPGFQGEIAQLELHLEKLRCAAYSKLAPWERVQICRHPQRPHTSDYIANLCEDFCELCGDRVFRDDRSIIGGFATIGEMRCVLIGQEKGHDTTTRIERNFGMPYPEGYRKALRLMQLAAKFSLPIVTLIDTSGAYPGLEAEERGQGRAIALNLLEMAHSPTPILSVIIGEGCSGGALAIAVADVIAMLEHSYYSVISPEGCASILWKDAAKKDEAASSLRLNSEDLLQFGIIDQVLPEPLGGAHHQPQFVYEGVKRFLLEKWELLSRMPVPLLLEQRYHKYRRMGAHRVMSS